MTHEIKVGCCIVTPIPFVRNSQGNFVKDTVAVDWHRARMALMWPTNFNQIQLFIDGLEVGDAREKAVRTILNYPKPPEFLAFLDWDVVPSPDAFLKLIYRAKHYPEIDMFCGVYCCKYMTLPEPLIYRRQGEGPYWDWSVGDLLTTEQHGITGIHMGLTLIRTTLFERMIEKGIVDSGSEEGEATLKSKPESDVFFKTIFEKHRRGTEDLFFCDLASKVDCQIMVDTSVLAGHVDKESGMVYGLPEDSAPIQKAKWIAKKGKFPDKEEAREEGLKIALDIGAGGIKREWEGYKTYTTDIRKDSKPDYIMDSRLLNFPDEHWDRVCSSHHLEHIGRWDQEEVWKEMFRVTKPGGDFEHIVPNLEWAAGHISKGNINESVFNVLYGAQEAHNYERDFNTHYFGYTPLVGKALAEAVGFIEVVTEDYKTNPELGYNLIIRGKKPNPDKVKETNKSKENGQIKHTPLRKVSELISEALLVE